MRVCRNGSRSQARVRSRGGGEGTLLRASKIGLSHAGTAPPVPPFALAGALGQHEWSARGPSSRFVGGCQPVTAVVDHSVVVPNSGHAHEHALGRGQLGVDQGLLEVLGRSADALVDIGVRQGPERVEQGRLVQGHRLAFLFVNLGGNTQNMHAVALRLAAPRRRAHDLRRATPRPGTSPGLAVGAGMGLPSWRPGRSSAYRGTSWTRTTRSAEPGPSSMICPRAAR